MEEGVLTLFVRRSTVISNERRWWHIKEHFKPARKTIKIVVKRESPWILCPALRAPNWVVAQHSLSGGKRSERLLVVLAGPKEQSTTCLSEVLNSCLAGKGDFWQEKHGKVVHSFSFSWFHRGFFVAPLPPASPRKVFDYSFPFHLPQLREQGKVLSITKGAKLFPKRCELQH